MFNPRGKSPREWRLVTKPPPYISRKRISILPGFAARSAKPIVEISKELSKRFSTAFVSNRDLTESEFQSIASIDDTDIDLRLTFQGDKQVTDDENLEGIRYCFGSVEQNKKNTFAVSYTQGRRVYMEDRHSNFIGDIGVIEQGYQIACFGVFDGHGGSNCSSFCEEECISRIISKISQEQPSKLFNPENPEDSSIASLMCSVMIEINDEYCNTAIQTGNNELEDGSTATVFQILSHYDILQNRIDFRCHVAGIGDSRAIYISFDKGGSVNSIKVLTNEHDCDNVKERETIEARGGDVYFDNRSNSYRVRGGFGESLAVSRSIGDAYFSKHVSGEPDVVELLYSEVEECEIGIVCVASDGIWGWVSNEEVGEIVQTHLREQKCTCGVQINGDLCCNCCSKSITTLAFDRGSDDNITTTLINVSLLCESMKQHSL